jgi:hypothetical protein
LTPYCGLEVQKPTQALQSVKGPGNTFDLGGFLHLKPTAGCQISTLIFDKKIMGGCLYKYSMKNILKTAKFLSTWGFNQRYFLGL